MGLVWDTNMAAVSLFWERLIHEPLAWEVGQPLLTLSSLNKIELIESSLGMSVKTKRSILTVLRKKRGQ